MRARKRTALGYIGGPIRTGGDDGTARVLSEAWKAAERSAAGTLTHGMHAYPGRMHPAIAATVLDAWTTPHSRVIDPFCGTGTVLIEAYARGLASLGVDLSPLALRIAEVQCQRRSEAARRSFLRALERVADQSRARVRGRVAVEAPIPRTEVRWYEPHVLRELAGLICDVQAVKDDRDRRALEVLFSAVVVKFSRQEANTSERRVERRIRKGLPTEFFERKGREWLSKWRALDEVSPARAPAVILREDDARNLSLIVRRDLHNFVLTSPPYGGVYDYVSHHRRRYAWLGLNPSRLERDEIGTRRSASPRAWREELTQALTAIQSVLTPPGRAVILLGDAVFRGRVQPARAELAQLAPHVGFSVLAYASQTRSTRPTRQEHLIALQPASSTSVSRSRTPPSVSTRR